MNKSKIVTVGCLITFVGLVGIFAAVFITPQFVERYISADSNISTSDLDRLTGYRFSALILGVSMLIGGCILLMLAPSLSNYEEEEILRILLKKRIVMVLAIIAWAILYLVYVLTHDIPVNPAGFYLESARLLIENGFRIPAYVDGFGENGIPFAFPPLGFYVLASARYLFGDLVSAALYIPGLLLPLQAMAMYLFMKQWTKSEQASQWAAIFLLFVPHIFFRTLYGDGITTGLAGIFLLLSWSVAVMSGRPGSYQRSLIGGILVGLSILSHPSVGLFCAITFSIFYLSKISFKIKEITGLIIAGVTAFVIILPWLLTVILQHGFNPILAALSTQKISLSSYQEIKVTLFEIIGEYTGLSEILALFLFPILLAILYNIIRGPRVIFLLLIALIFPFGGHPSFSMFVFAPSIGIFFGEILLPAMNQGNQQFRRHKPEHDTPNVSWNSLLFAGIYLSLLFILCLPYAIEPSISSGEIATYDWIRSNTESNSTFLMDFPEENLVYFGRRTILFPILGAEWVLTTEYGNGLGKNSMIMSEIYACRQVECFRRTFTKYGVTPDYIIFSISDNSDGAWIEELNASPMFEVVFESETMVTLQILE